MNRKIASALLIAAAAAASFGARADEADSSQYAVQFQGSRSRADVQAELTAYKQAGVNPWSISYNPLRSFKSTTSREQVVAAYIASRNEVAALNGEDSGSVHLAQARALQRSGTQLAGQPHSGQ
ncbi:DUF4148 domain-containing protein [uncultured Ramlibacter sp.]|uniref:DUF4148 domain-containing protein n=1 Tax=uncultured Ramlibacter sp. TaxID=260755 RepID=UPI0026026EB0|nr:DUF4148 domain-containing protein [uncultured Ramlibacter sp.]